MQPSAFDPVAIRQASIGRGLRAVYDGVTTSPLPDLIDTLLAELDKIAAPDCGH